MSYALRAIIEFSSKSNQAKFRTPNAFLTKRDRIPEIGGPKIQRGQLAQLAGLEGYAQPSAVL